MSLINKTTNCFAFDFQMTFDPLLFTFLVNYIAYPFDLNPANRPTLVVGTTTLTRGYEELDE